MTVSTEQELAAAITAANNNYPTPSTIDLAADIDLTQVRESMFGPVGLPVIKGIVTINGNGFHIRRSPSAQNEFRILAVDAKTSGHPNASLALNNVAILNGWLANHGAAALVMDAPVTITDSYIAHNVGKGTGGIYVGDGYTLTASGTVFEHNDGLGGNARGGAIYSSTGSSLYLENCIFKANRVPDNPPPNWSFGGAIYRHFGGSVIVLDCSFTGNEAAAGGAIYNTSGSLDARWNWWGRVEGPRSIGYGLDSIDGPGLGSIQYTPYRPTLPRFTPTAFVPTNPCLPDAIAGCTLTVLRDGVNIRRGPSIDDLALGTLNSGATYPVRAVALDEEGSTWYGFLHAGHPNYLTWIVDTYQGTQYTSISCAVSPNFSTQSENTWTAILEFASFPFSAPVDPTNSPFRGFGYVDSIYEDYAGCRHPGQDFFPAVESGVHALAMADGIVVGVGPQGELNDNPPATWGAVEGGYNLVVRTGGHFVLYGHLSDIEPHLYLGARVRAGEKVGTIWHQGDNTHVHIEVRAFVGSIGALIRPRFGAVNHNGTVLPSRAIDPFVFANPGTKSNTARIESPPCGQPDYDLDYYDTSLGGVTFSYKIHSEMHLVCFDINNGETFPESPSSVCLSQHP